MFVCLKCLSSLQQAISIFKLKRLHIHIASISYNMYFIIVISEFQFTLGAFEIISISQMYLILAIQCVYIMLKEIRYIVRINFLINIRFCYLRRWITMKCTLYTHMFIIHYLLTQ